MPSIAPQAICENALADINAVAAGQTVSAENYALALSHFNRMLGVWRTQRLFAFYIRSQAFAFAVSQQSYTFGPTGNFAITGERPGKLERAKLVLTASSPDSELDLRLIEVDQYADFSTPALSG